MSNIRDYVPYIYKDVEEMDAIINSQDKMLDMAENTIDIIYNSQYITLLPEAVLPEYEKLLNILPNSTDTVEFRRERIMNRLSMTPPFSLPYLRKKLNELIGEGKYNCYMDYDNYTLYVESSAENQVWANEIYITINKLKPTNIVFINKSLIVYNNNISEAIELTKSIYNYKLGTTWALGQKPFMSTESGGLIKMANIPSLQEKFLNDIAHFSASDINNVLINDTYLVSDFTNKSSEDNVAVIEYSVPVSSGLSEITNVKLRDIENNVLTESSVYVPVIEDVLLKHLIYVKEGV